MKDKFLIEITKILNTKIIKNASIKNDNHLKIEAIFKYKIEVYDYISAIKVFKTIKKYKKRFYIVGNGSNVFFKRKYYNCVLIKIMPFKSKELNIISGGVSLNYLNNIYLNKGIVSLNFLVGVPCNVLGAIYMNAGAFNIEMKDIIEYVYFLDLETFTIKVYDNKRCNFSYRDSYFKHHRVVILGAKIRLLYKSINEAKLDRVEYLKIRQEKMPLEYPNLGSVFKNPEGYYAGKLIDDLGLKGYKKGDFMISYKHGNVIVNLGDGKSKDFYKLISIIRHKVYKFYKTKLELEIIVFK